MGLIHNYIKVQKWQLEYMEELCIDSHWKESRQWKKSVCYTDRKKENMIFKPIRFSYSNLLKFAAKMSPR